MEQLLLLIDFENSLINQHFCAYFFRLFLGNMNFVQI